MNTYQILQKRAEILQELSKKYQVPIMNTRQNQKPVFCKNCSKSEINFWGYVECYQFNHEIDFESTVNIAERERTSIALNSENQCCYYEEKRWWVKMWNRLQSKFSKKSR